MKFKFNNIMPEEDVPYAGVVKKAVVDKDKNALRVYVELDDFEGAVFMKYLPIAMTFNSAFMQFCENMEIIDEKRQAETDDLVGKEIACTLNRVDDKFFVNEIYLLAYNLDLFEDEYEDDRTDESD